MRDVPSHRYRDVAILPRPELDVVFESGTPVPMDELEGWEFCGWNCSTLPRLGGFQKFVKVFRRAPDGTDEGWNHVVLQNGIDGEWLGAPEDSRPKRQGYYVVRRAHDRERSGAPEGALLLDYGTHRRNPWFDPSRLLRDVLVKIEGDPDLLIGKAHLAVGTWMFAGYFLLERHRPLRDPW